MPRITRISGSFAIVLIAYWAYALAAVPWIEPSANLKFTGQVAGGKTPSNGPDLPAQQLLSFQDLFPPGAWEITSSDIKVFESDRAKLLLREYHNLGGGKVEFKPCTIVFDYDGPAENEAQRHRQSIILQAPEAILQFDRPLDFKNMQEANLEGGRLNGEVVIRSDWKRPGPEDDLRIVTRDIQLAQQTISTSEPVEFRWGPYFGSGQDMQMKLLPGKPGAGGLNFAGIESFELRHVERLHLDLGREPGEPEKGISPICRNGPEGASHKLDLSPFPPGSTPVDIGCRGPFQFDVVRRVASFRDSVRVVKPNPTGDPDQIVCELLSLWFIERPKKKPLGAAAKAAVRETGSLDLTPERLEAQGNPVVVTAPSKNITARGQRIEYNLLSKSITLDGDQRIFLQQGPNEIHARSLFYQSAAEEGRLGQLMSQGPGWLHGQSPDQPDQQLEAVWQDQLQIQPHDQYQEISLTGGAELKSPNIGQLQAKKIFLWLTETPSAGTNNNFTLHPHGLRANDDVHISSSQLSGKVGLLEVWFEEGGQELGVGGQRLAAASARRESGMAGLPPNDATVQQAPQRQSITLLPPTTPQAAMQHFEVVGRLLRARVLLAPPKPALLNLTIEDGVQFDETQTSQPGERLLLIRGNRLDVDNASGTASVIGQPARFEGRGLGLTGSNINLNRGTNHLWIDGAGQMDIVVASDPQGRPLPTPSTLTVDWRHRMDFDGQTATFKQSVVATTPGIPAPTGMTDFKLQTDTMDVQLQRPIRFSEQTRQEPPQVEEIRCVGGVAMESHSFDARQQLIAHDQMQLADLAVNQLSGAINGGGPGWINTVRHGSNDMPGGQPIAAAGNAPANADPLYCLHITFQGPVTGNYPLRHEVSDISKIAFHDQVRIACAPVDRWDVMLATDDPNRLGPDGIVGRCDELRVVQMFLPVGGREAIELYALGNAVVEGATFKATGGSITYAQAKDLLTIEGDGRNLAELFQQKQPGDPVSRLPAQKILYWRKTKDVRVIGAQMLEVQLPDGEKEIEDAKVKSLRRRRPSLPWPSATWRSSIAWPAGTACCWWPQPCWQAFICPLLACGIWERSPAAALYRHE